jgi:hypothetical protein
MLAANWTFNLVTPIKRTNQKTEEVTTPDQELAGKYFGKQ